jgi:hypothetical protein
MKTSELTGAALDWAVAKCEGATDEWRADGPFWWDGVPCIRSGGHDVNYHPSTDWSQGGPIIEREAITVSEGSPVVGLEWMACDRGSTHIQHGPTYLIAAMRCYVASKLGDDINIPEELL